MKAEKVIISFVAVIIGIIAAGVAFYFYQSTKTITPPKITKTPVALSPSPAPDNSFFLAIDTPKDEDVVEKKTVTISGKTIPDAFVIISTPLGEEIITPSKSGTFSTTTTIEDGSSIIEIIAIAPDGKEQKQIRTITFSTENF